MSADRQWLDLSLDELPPAKADRVRIFRLLVVQGARLRSLMDRKLAPSGLTTQQAAMLTWIEAQGAPPTISAVAAGLTMTHQNVKQIAVALERKGFLAIQIDAEDRRARRLVLTDKHRRFWRRRNADDYAVVEAWMAVWSDAEVRQIKRLLIRLHRYLDDCGPEGAP